jgi:EcsC protein family
MVRCRGCYEPAPPATGAVGGGFGLAALPVELPISTIIMLRSIGDIARSEGENLADPDSALACLQVFALGTRDGEASAAESGYFAARGLLAPHLPPMRGGWQWPSMHATSGINWTSAAPAARTRSSPRGDRASTGFSVVRS